METNQTENGKELSPFENAPECPHCNKKMLPWKTPDMTNWTSKFVWVCFNDECDYFKRGWKWMEEKYSKHVSYRHKLDPETGETGPLPVWSEDALREGIITKKTGS